MVRPLRAEVLRPGRPVQDSVLPFDEDPRSRHLAVVVDGRVVSVGSLLPEAPPCAPERTDAWRIRGMATAAGVRGRGYGAQVLSTLLELAARSGGRLVWCNARATARSFYERAGFTATGEPFIAEGVEHIVMWRPLAATKDAHR
jgi:predicted GNAT family N-acyltransferase